MTTKGPVGIKIGFFTPRKQGNIIKKGGKGMRKGIVLALLAAFCMMAFGAVVVAEEGMKTIDAPAEKFPAKKLKDGKKAKPPVTFNHAKHGADNGCVTCHHTAASDDEVKAGAKSCFECHGPEAEDKKLDTYKMIHDKKAGKCLKCHNEKKDAGAPTKCKECHK